MSAEFSEIPWNMTFSGRAKRLVKTGLADEILERTGIFNGWRGTGCILKNAMSLFRSVFLLVALFTAAASAVAGPFTSLVVYGDSLSDNGNFFAATGQPPAPYFEGRFSNGPVAAERLKALLNVDLVDFAWGGATTGIGNSLDGGSPTSINFLPGMRTLFDGTQGSLGPLIDGLFLVWGGPNDLLSSTDANPLETADRAVDNLLYIVEGLQDLGAQHILVPGITDLGLTPRVRALGPDAQEQVTALSNYLNASLRSSLPQGVTYFDTAGLLRSVVSDPTAYGLTNVTEPCRTAAVCAEPDKYLFWDDVHPTTAGHAILAQEFASAVPEPSTTILAFAGLGLFLAFSKCPQKARRRSVASNGRVRTLPAAKSL